MLKWGCSGWIGWSGLRRCTCRCFLVCRSGLIGLQKYKNCQWIDKVFPWFVDWSKLELQNNDHFLDAGAGVSVSKDKIGRKSNASRQMKILYE